MRRDCVIDVFDEAGQKVLSYKVFRCWVSDFQTMPDLDTDAHAVAILAIKLENEGWECDVVPVEPEDSSFTGTHGPDGRQPTGYQQPAA